MSAKHLSAKHLDPKHSGAKHLDPKHLDPKHLEARYLDARTFVTPAAHHGAERRHASMCASAAGPAQNGSALLR